MWCEYVCVCDVYRTVQLADDTRRRMAATLARRNPGMTAGDVSSVVGVVQTLLTTPTSLHSPRRICQDLCVI